MVVVVVVVVVVMMVMVVVMVVLMFDDKLCSLVLTSALNFILNKIILGYFSCGVGVWSSGGGGDGGNG